MTVIPKRTFQQASVGAKTRSAKYIKISVILDHPVKDYFSFMEVWGKNAEKHGDRK